MTIKQLVGTPVFDISTRRYLGQYLGHIVTSVRNTLVWQFELGHYEVFVEDENKRLYPIFVSGIPTTYAQLLVQGQIKPKMFYEFRQKFSTIGVDQRHIINLDYVLEGRDDILFVDMLGIFEEDIEIIKKLDSIAELKQILQSHEEKIYALKSAVVDYKNLYELTLREKELIETQLERYRTFYRNIRLVTIEMETELDKLRTVIERLTRQVDMEREERERLESIIQNLRNYILNIKNIEEKVEKELESKEEGGKK